MSSSPAWPTWLDPLWAKGLGPGGEVGESLAAHTWEDLQRLRDLAELRPDLPMLAGLPQLWHVLFWSIFLHDWGKAATGFQDMLRGGLPWPLRHEVLSLAFAEWVRPLFDEDEYLALICTIATHHRDGDQIVADYLRRLEPEHDPIVALVKQINESTVSSLCQWLTTCAQNWIVHLGFDRLGVTAPSSVDVDAKRFLSGSELDIRQALSRVKRLLTTLERDRDDDWVLRGVILRGCMLQADHTGSAHIGAIPPLALKRQDVLAALGKPVEQLYQHQRDLGGCQVSSVLTSPTGSGKTEAALLWAVSMVEHNRAARLYYTLPYQASMNAMYDRLNGVFPGQLGLAHSRSLLALYQRMVEDGHEKEYARRLARSAKDLARLHHWPIQVFSPYQMLKAAYQLKGYEALLTSYSCGAFVFDEIHAYEPRRLAMILELVRFLRGKLNASFLVMSATMPGVIRRKVQNAIGSNVVVTASDELYQGFIRHQLHLIDDDLVSDAVLQRIISDFAGGSSVLVVCNTVARAQQVMYSLEDYVSADAITLVHGRFNGRDRLVKEAAIIKHTGVHATERQPVIVVATQVVEVSLNIDLDVLYTDPAPLEALLQRFGRINRRRSKLRAPVYVCTEAGEGWNIYLPSLVEKSLAVLREQADGRDINESCVQNWLDEHIYADELLQDWEREYAWAAKEFRRAFIEEMQPFSSAPGLEEEFDRLFDSVEVLPVQLEQEYLALMQESPIEASQLLVSISSQQYWRLKAAGKVRRGDEVARVDMPYSSEYGLQLEL